jgi:hypothetical protein
MKLITEVITISAAATAKTAKIQFHQYFVIGIKDIYEKWKKLDFLILLTYLCKRNDKTA